MRSVGLSNAPPAPLPYPSRMARVLLAMSGGVDSSVAAHLLLEQGHDVVGVFMRLGSPGDTLDTPIPSDADSCPPARIGRQGCCSVGDAADARLVAAQLAIPFYVVNFRREFGRIMDYFVSQYAAGRTPNPCVRCNDWLKFGRLHDYARQIDADVVASGHYARLDHSDPRRPRLLRAVDHDKDQSYVLFGAPRDSLRRMLLPVGAFTKARIREIARRHDLPVSDKPDSQEICFVHDNDYARFVESRAPQLRVEGRILDLTGRDLGAHAGHHRFTIGQRRGLRIASPDPVFVLDKDPQANTITVGPREALLAHALTAREVNWLADPDAFADFRPCAAKIRYNAPPAPARCRVDPDADQLEVRFDEPQEAVAPGQAVVCYDGDTVLGGGWIESSTRAD